MISINIVEIAVPDDYDKLEPLVPDDVYNIKAVIQELKGRIGTSAKKVVVEYPYNDHDYNSVYSSYYTKQHKARPKECYRFHFFAGGETDQENYRGFVVIRPSFINSSIGRAQLDPRLLVSTGSAFIMQSNRFSANLAGERFDVSSFPWMAQETDVAICAHSAVWSIIRYFSQKYPHHQQLILDDVVQKAPIYLNRKIPYDGLNFFQISSILSQAGFHCLFLAKEIHGDEVLNNVKIYIESGIPVIAGIKRRQHAVVLVGHGRVDHAKLNGSASSYTLSTSLIDTLIAIDDNYLPYVEVGAADNCGGYNISDIDYAVVPLYEKMFLPANIMLSKVTSLIDKGGHGFPANPVLRPYLTSSRSLKKRASESGDMPDTLKELVLAVEMPKFVWCVDICTEDEFKQGLCSSRVIVDATAGTYDPNPWLLIHNDNRTTYYDRLDQAWRFKTEPVSPYQIYRNNLVEV